MSVPNNLIYSTSDLLKLGELLHIVDPNLPIGGFNHSNGLETFIQDKTITNKESLFNFILSQLRHNWIYNDAAYASLAFTYCKQNNLQELINLSVHYKATKVAKELRVASEKLGIRLLKIYQLNLKTNSRFDDISSLIQDKKITAFYPLIFGIITELLEIDQQSMLYALLFNMLVGLVTNGVKLIPLSQMDGQDLIFKLNSELVDAVTKTINLDIKWLASCSITYEIRAMQHEFLYSRLYMS